MSYAIIGFGKIGHALAKAFARKGIEVSVATTRDPKSFAADAAAIGPTIIPKKLTEAVKADIVELLLAKDARIERTTYYGFTLDQHIEYALRVNTSPAAQAALKKIEQLVKARRQRDAARRPVRDRPMIRLVLRGSKHSATICCMGYPPPLAA